MKRAAFLLFLWLLLRAPAAEAPPHETPSAIAVLRREIAHHDELYHRQTEPEISDAEYDRLKLRLAKLEQLYPAAARAAEPLAAVGDDRSGRFETSRHLERMLSLDKAYKEPELRAFYARLVKAVGASDLAFVVEPKFDGLAVSVTYERGRLIRAVTRGNGIEGDDITANVIKISTVRRELLEARAGPWPDLVELRGEIFVPFVEFDRVNAERERSGEALFANPRNLAAGTMRQTDAEEIARRGLQIVFHGLGACEPGTALPGTQQGLQALIRAWGLPGIPETWIARGADELVRAVETVNRARAAFPFPTDGAVVKVDALTYQHAIGDGETAPRWALAYKFAPDRVETQLRAITLQVGRTGVLTPVAELVPVQITGSRVARATLHNREEIVRKDVRLGDFVYVEKAGDIIPAVVGVNLERRSPQSQPYPFPIACPACYAPVIRGDTEGAMQCPNLACPAQVSRRLEHFASKACMDIDGLGPAMAESLVSAGWVKDVPDLYRLRRTDLLTLGKNNEKSVDRLLAAIERSKHAELWRVIHGLGIPQVGAATAKDLARQCGSLSAVAEQGPKAVVVLAEPRFQDLIADLIALGVSPTPEGVGSARLAGKTVVMTGTLPNLTRAEASGKIEKAGGKIATALSRETHYLVAGENPGAKLARARELAVPVLDEAALLRLIEEGVDAK